MNFKNNNFVIIAVLVFLFIGLNTSAQVGVGTSTPNANAMLDVESTEKGFLPPRMSTAQKTTLGGLLVATDEGMTIYDTDNNTYEVWDGAAWAVLGSGGISSSSTSIGNMYFNAAASTTISATASKLNGSGVTIISNSTDFTTSADNRLTYTGTDTKVFSVHMSLSFYRTSIPPLTQGAAEFFLSKNGGSSAENFVSTSIGLKAMPTGFIDDGMVVNFTGTVSLDTNDYIEIWGQTTGGSGSVPISVTNLNVVLD